MSLSEAPWPDLLKRGQTPLFKSRAVYVFMNDKGEPRESPVWIYGQKGLLSAQAKAEDQSFAVLAEDRASASFHAGFLSDEIQIGAYRFAVKGRQSTKAKEALAAFLAEAPLEATSSSRERRELPESGVDSEPLALDEGEAWRRLGLEAKAEGQPPWLWVVSLKNRIPVFGRDGQSREQRAYLGIDAHQLWLGAGQEGAEPWLLKLEGSLGLEGDTLWAGAWKLSPQNRDAASVWAFSQLDPEARIAEALQMALASGDLGLSVSLRVRLEAERFRLEHALWLAAWLATLEADALALALLSSKFRSEPSLASLGSLGSLDALKDQAKALQKALKSLRPKQASALLSWAKATWPEATMPQRFPAPPASFLELIALALAGAGAVEAAQSLAAESSGLRAEQLNLAVLPRVDEKAWQALEAKAVEAGDLLRAAAASEVLARHTGDPRCWLRRAVYAAHLKADPEVDLAFERAVKLGPDREAWTAFVAQLYDPKVRLQPPKNGDAGWALAPTWCDRLIQDAQSQGARRAAAELIWARDGRDPWPDRRVQAERVETELRIDDIAAGLWMQLAETSEDEAEAAFKRAASLYAKLDDRVRLQEALVGLLERAFLRAEVYRFIHGYAAQLDPATRDWWAHMETVLVGGSELEQDSAAKARYLGYQGLSEAELESLRLDKSGWLDRASQALSETLPPSKADLTRGLAPITEGPAYELWLRLSQGLRLTPPAIYRYCGEAGYGASAWPTEPPVLLLGDRHLQDGQRRLSEKALAFMLAVELSHLAYHHPLFGLSSALGGKHGASMRLGSTVSFAETALELLFMIPGIDQIGKIQRLLRMARGLMTAKTAMSKAYALAKPVEKLIRNKSGGSGGVGKTGLLGSALQMRAEADRAALMMTRDLGAAVEAILAAADRPERLGPGGLLAKIEAEALTPEIELRIGALFLFAVRLPDRVAAMPGADAPKVDGITASEAAQIPGESAMPEA